MKSVRVRAEASRNRDFAKIFAGIVEIIFFSV
jgi:hypothetical protein